MNWNEKSDGQESMTTVESTGNIKMYIITSIGVLWPIRNTVNRLLFANILFLHD